MVRGLGDANARRSHSDDCRLCRKRRFVGETRSRLTATDLLDNSGPNGSPVLNYAAAEDIRPRRRWPDGPPIVVTATNSPQTITTTAMTMMRNKKIKDGLVSTLWFLLLLE